MNTQEPLNLSVYNRAKELYMQIDELGNNIYSLDEISDTLTKEGYIKYHSKSSLSRFAKAHNWQSQRESKIKATITKNLPKSNTSKEALSDAFDMQKVLDQTQRSYSKALNKMEEYLDNVEINDKNISNVAKIAEVVGKKSDIILEKYIDHENNQKEINLLDKALEKISQSSSKFETIDIEEHSC
jgi:vacuolar-type H+-ATPase subunit I/STV1